VRARTAVFSTFAMLAALSLSGGADGQTMETPGWGRVSLFGMWSRTTAPDVAGGDFSQVSAAVTLRSATDSNGGVDYGFDVRGAGYPSTAQRKNQYSIYDAYVGARSTGGRFGFRAGQMWLNELGSLGSVGGLLIDYRQKDPWAAGRLRAGIFGGLEPKILEAGYAKGVRKFGGFVALDGDNARSHVIGIVQLRDSGMTERSVLTMTNFIPSGRTFFLYQGLEYDLAKPGGLARSGLNYFFANLRWAPAPWLEIQGLYHHGRSVDSRTITQDQLNGIPVDARTVEGFLFDSAGGRVTFRIASGLSVYAGYSRERDNSGDPSYGRANLGLFASNVLGSGFDVVVSDYRSDRSGATSDSWYASLGRNLGARFYVSADYSTSLSLLKFVSSGGVTIQSQPRTRRYGLYGLWNVDRHFSISATAEQIRDDASRSVRGLLGLMYRF
jgi:hypothetical protein